MKTNTSILFMLMFVLTSVYSNNKSDKNSVTLLNFYVSNLGELVDKSPNKKLLKKYSINEIMAGYSPEGFGDMVDEIEDEIVFNLILELEDQGKTINQVILEPDKDCAISNQCLHFEAYTLDDSVLVINRKKITNPEQTFNRKSKNPVNRIHKNDCEKAVTGKFKELDNSSSEDLLTTNISY